MQYKYFREIQPERAIQGNFASGQINYKFDYNDGHTYWNPSKSYIKIKMKITKGDGTRLDKDFGVAPNMYIADNLFQQIDMRCNGTCVSEWNDYIAQCASLKNRLYNSMNHREALLSSVNYSKIDLIDRLSQVSSDGYKERDIVWRRGVQLGNLAASGRTLDFLDLVTPNTVQFVNATSGIIFREAGGNKIPDMSKYFAIGDYIYFQDGGGEEAQTVTGYLTTDKRNDTLVVSGNVDDNAAAPLVAQVRIHNDYYPERLYSNSVQANDMQIIWKPPIGFWDVDDLLCGSYKLELTPHAEGVYQKFAIESILDKAVGLTANDIAVEITEINMYLCTYVTPSPISGSKSYTYSDIRCHSQNLTTNSLTSKVYPIHERNHSISIAWQDSAAGDDTRLSRSKFKIVDEQELNLVRYYIQKDGIQLPDPIPRLSVNQNTGVNQFHQRYYENMQYSDAYENLEKNETLKQWIDAGIFFHYKWGQGYRKTDNAVVYQNFSTSFKGEDEATLRNPQALLFDHYYCTVSMNIVGGKLISVTKS